MKCLFQLTASTSQWTHRLEVLSNWFFFLIKCYFCLSLFGCSSLPIFLVWNAPLLQHFIRTKVGHFIRYQSWRIQKSFHSGFGLSWFDFSSHFVGYRTGKRSHKPVDESIYESKVATFPYKVTETIGVAQNKTKCPSGFLTKMVCPTTCTKAKTQISS